MRGGNLVQWRRRYDNLGLRFHLDDERLVEGSAVLGEISAAAHRRNSPMIAANAAADNHKIAAQRHGNSVRRNITAACRQLVLVERRLRIRPQEVFFYWSPHAIAFGSGPIVAPKFRSVKTRPKTNGLSERGRTGVAA